MPIWLNEGMEIGGLTRKESAMEGNEGKGNGTVAEMPAVDDEDDDYEYEEVEVEDEEELDALEAEDLESAMRSLQVGEKKAGGTEQEAQEGQRQERIVEGEEELGPGEVKRRPEDVDDFVRNFLMRMGMEKTLDQFDTEWYELKVTGKLNEEHIKPVADVYERNKELHEQVNKLRESLTSATNVAEKAKESWDRFKRERDFHKRHHKRVQQEKNKLMTDIKRLQNHYSQYEPTIRDLRAKYETAMKEKMLLSIERDRLQSRLDSLLEQPSSPSPNATSHSAQEPGSALPASQQEKAPPSDHHHPKDKAKQQQQHSGGNTQKQRGLTLPQTNRPNPNAGAELPHAECGALRMTASVDAHSLPIADVAIHPSKKIVATSGDDRLWKLWSVPGGELVLSGEGHKDWVANASFHPEGRNLATASGDCTVKVWDFEKGRAVATFSDHTQAVWHVDFHDTGDFLCSGSLDHSARIFSLPANKCIQTLRGHVDSVNAVQWQPYGNIVLTASSDKTVSLWDPRSGLAVQTLYGHLNSCNSACFSADANLVTSCDADGIVKVWDVRKVAEVSSADFGPSPLNRVAFDPAASTVAAASDDASVKCVDPYSGELLASLEEHADAVQAVCFDSSAQLLLSVSADCTLKCWG